MDGIRIRSLTQTTIRRKHLLENDLEQQRAYSEPSPSVSHSFKAREFSENGLRRPKSLT
jgi:hypothetical protein